MLKLSQVSIINAVFGAVLCFIGSLTIYGQTVSPTPIALEDMLFQAEKQTKIYKETFKNLLADETKTFEEYDSESRLKEKLVVESNFIVYQSVKNENIVTEYRNVLRVGGKPVGDNNKRAQDFFEELAKAESSSKEIDKIQAESSRYDRSLAISDMTINQSPILAAHIRPAFDFQFLGNEIIDGVELAVIQYRQKSKSPYILFNEKEKPGDGTLKLRFDFDVPKSFKDAKTLLRGKLWINRQTFEVWREQRELIIQPKNLPEPLTILQSEFQYQTAKTGTLVPQKIVFTDFRFKSKGAEIFASPKTKVTFEYKNFSLPNVEIKSGEVNSDKPKKN